MRPSCDIMPARKGSSCDLAAGVSSSQSVPVIIARMNISFRRVTCVLSCMCSSSTSESAIVRMPARPISDTARGTEAMVPAPALRKCAVLTRRSSLLVSATSRTISSVTPSMLASSDCVTRWMRTTASDSAGKSLLWRMRRSRNSSVARSPPSAPAGAGSSHSCSALRNALADSGRRDGSRETARITSARNASSVASLPSLPFLPSSGHATSSLNVRSSARYGSRSSSMGRPQIICPSIMPAANTSISGCAVAPPMASGEM